MSFDTSAARTHLNIQTAAARLGLSEITLRRMIARGEISYIRLGSKRGRIVFDESHLNDYLRRRTVQARAA